MAAFTGYLKAAAATTVLVTAVLMVLEIAGIYYSYRETNYRGAESGVSVHLMRSDDILINPSAQLPNAGRVKRVNGARVPELSNDVGTRSVHNGGHQRERQRWLRQRAECIRSGDSGCTGRGYVGGAGSTNPEGGAGVNPAEPAVPAAAEETEEAAAQLQSQAQLPPADSNGNESGGGDVRDGVGDVGSGVGGGQESVRAGDGAPAFLRHSIAGADRNHFLKTARGGELAEPPRPDGDREEEEEEEEERLALERDDGTGGGGQEGAGEAEGKQEEGKEEQQEKEGEEGERGEQEGDAEVPPRIRGLSRSPGGGLSGGRGGVGGDEGQGMQAEGGGGIGEVVELPVEERLSRLEAGVKLWGGTYVPPIAPEEKLRLLEKWTAPPRQEGGDAGHFKFAVGAPRILFVITSFDRGRRLERQMGKMASSIDKLDYVLMIMDEVREACEAGFSPHLHFISAWNARPELDLFSDRLFCRRTGGPVPLTLEEHSPKINEVLSIKHRVYMKPRVKEYDLFVQVEDDMILTINHILRYLEESQRLSSRSVPSHPLMYDFMPGFMRVEPEPGVGGVRGEWFEWEIILSRFRGVNVVGSGTYLALDRSRVLPYSGNNQGMWMATQEQLKYLMRQCQYLRYTEKSNLPFVEKFSGSLEMFSPECHNTKVFPVTHFEDFMVHHRTNNKNGKRGESMPAVSVSMLRLWAAQVVRDADMLMEVGKTDRRRRLLRQ